MEQSPSVDDALRRWQDLREQGKPSTVEDLCGDCPEKIAEVKERLRAVASMMSLLGLEPEPVPIGTLATEDRGRAGSSPMNVGEPPGPGPDLADPSTMVRIPGYEVLGELGRGGMGVVYEARQVSLNRPVALKMVGAGQLAGDAELRRFRNEAEAVALLDHPGVVPIYEVGAHGGQHYFSMKLVAGGSLVPLMPRYKGDPRAAARLVAETAEAVAHAHVRGILHRDLKPANILVDEEGHPHVTDFGLAKKVAADIELTQSGAILGTPAYMSPEQAGGRRGAVTTASDVYGLGAVLYALMTGRAPFDGDTVVETIDAVRSMPPEPPRRLNSAVPHDLETICLRCLEKDPRRRYSTAQALADDLRSWLDNRPIAARRVRPAERAWLWCRRRPAIAALSAAVLLAVGGGAGAMITVQHAANRKLDAKNADLRQANARVQARFELAREAIRSFKAGVEEEEALKEDRLRPLRDKLLGSARRFYDKLGSLLEGHADAASKTVLAESYLELGELIDVIGQKPEVLEAYRKAVAIRRELAAMPGAGTAARLDLVMALNAQARASQQLGDLDGGRVANQEASDLLEPLTVENPEVHDYLRQVAYAHNWVSALMEKVGDTRGALAERQKYQIMMQALVAEHPDIPQYRSDVALGHGFVGGLLEATGDRPGALVELRKYQEMMQALATEHPDVAIYRHGLAWSHNLIGRLLDRDGDPRGALAEKQTYLQLMQALVTDYRDKPEFRRDLALAHAQVGVSLEKKGDLRGALVEQRNSEGLFQSLVDEHPAVLEFRHALANSHAGAGDLLEKTSDTAGALAEQRRYRELMRALAAEHPDVPLYRSDLAVSHNKVGVLLTLAGKPAEALGEHDRARSLAESLAQAVPNIPEYRDELATALIFGSDALRDLGRAAEARAGLARAQSLASAQPNAPRYRARLADALRRLALLKLNIGDAAGADADARRAIALLEALPTRVGGQWFGLACARATLAAVVGGTGPSAVAAPGLADQAMNDLRRAAGEGHRNPAAYSYEPALGPLRARDDFRLLMQDLVFPADPFT